MNQAEDRTAEQLSRTLPEALDRGGDHLAAAYVSKALGVAELASPTGQSR